MNPLEKFERVEERWHLAIEKDRIKSLSFSREVGRAVRVIVNGKVGFASAVGESFEKIEKIATELARFSGEELDSFPPRSSSIRTPKIYDSKVEELTPDELKSIGEEIIDSARRGSVASGCVEIAKIDTKIENPEFSGEYSETSTFVFVEVVREGSAYNYTQSRKVRVDVEKVVELADRLAGRPSKIAGGKNVQVSLSPIAMNQLLSHTLYPAFSAENVVKGRSPVVVGSDFGWNFRIFDDPLIDWGLNSYPFDDEGVKAKKRELYSESVKSLLSNWKFSKILKVEPGNALREESTSYPEISTSNVVIDIDVEDFDISETMYVHSLVGAHTANPVNGDFSVECSNAVLGGKPVRAMLYGNVYDVLKGVLCQTKPEQIDSTVCGTVLFDRGTIKIV